MNSGGEMRNVYTDASYAGEYAELGWTGTYHLVRRELPRVLHLHGVTGLALDFGCGTGRSTRLLREAGFQVVGVDVSEAMIDRARLLDPSQDYRVISDGDFSEFNPEGFDLVLACFPFDNISGRERKVALLRGLASLLRPSGLLVNVVSSPEIYVNEWASFTTAQFEQNRSARPGDLVQIITTDFADAHVCDDVLFDDESYLDVYQAAGLRVVASYRPLGLPDEPVTWVSELHIAPWVIWVLQPTN